MKTSDFTIWPTSHPIARAASCAVFVPSGNRRTSGSTPSTRAASMNRSIAPLIAATSRSDQVVRPGGELLRQPLQRPARIPQRLVPSESLHQGYHGHAVQRQAGLGVAAHDRDGDESSRPSPRIPPGTLPRSDPASSSPFARDHEIGCRHPRVQPERVGHHVDPRPDVRTQERHQPEPQPSRGAGAGLVAQIDAEVPRHDGGQMGQRAIEQDHVVRPTRPSADRRPRSRRRGPVSGLSTSVAATNVTPSQPPIESRDVDARQAAERQPASPRSPVRVRRWKRTPSACAIPTPPSFVALPPRPTISRSGSRSSAARDQLAGARGGRQPRVTPAVPRGARGPTRTPSPRSRHVPRSSRRSRTRPRPGRRADRRP